MSWPLSQEYNEAVQYPADNFADPDLRRGEAVTNALGIPVPRSGNFADVYQVRGPDGGRWAVKCFTRSVPDLRERYQEIGRRLRQARLPFTVDFRYLVEGIHVAGRWRPVLKMEWVEGLTLNQFVAQALDRPAALEALLQIWARMARRLRSGGRPLRPAARQRPAGSGRPRPFAGAEADRLRRHVGPVAGTNEVRGSRPPVVPAPPATPRRDVQCGGGPLPAPAGRHGAARPDGGRKAVVGQVRQR